MAINTNSKKSQHRIVIVGGGAGGLELATMLGKKLGKKMKARITLIDVNQTHLWKPLLHQVAAGSLNAFEDELSYLAQAKWNYFHFFPGYMENINRQQKIISLAPIYIKDEQIVPSRHIKYDTLVIAIGSTANDFNTPGAKEHCFFINNRIQAENIHATLLKHYMHAQAKDNKLSKLKISIIGAGATGVELAAELHNAAIELEHYGLDAINHGKLDITLLEGGQRILAALPRRISDSVQKQLTKIGIKIMTNQRVSEITSNGLIINKTDFIDADLKIWAAGIKAPSLLSEIDGLQSNHINQLIIRPTLQTTLDDNIYAIGDCSSCTLTNKKGNSVTIPPRAQAAHQQATLLASSLALVVRGIPPLEFTYKDYGSLISLSRFSAIGNLMGIISGDMVIEGTLAKLFYIGLYRMHQMALFGKIKTVALILRDLIGKATRPQLKLH